MILFAAIFFALAASALSIFAASITWRVTQSSIRTMNWGVSFPVVAWITYVAIGEWPNALEDITGAIFFVAMGAVFFGVVGAFTSAVYLEFKDAK